MSLSKDLAVTTLSESKHCKAMGEEFSMEDPTPLLEFASDFTYYPGDQVHPSSLLSHRNISGQLLKRSPPRKEEEGTKSRQT
ncbi:hypothetical protein P3X46_006863 [Hevea brasiliensis]|uniref:Uncharacterized protein n=1 Tax=Hevea brasiliensis TaxID=3981 RepID=A0ABQ9MRL7_HEVBR|nr:hypothetical protein P3X46_006863 [Hevea brasiliensis]